MTKRNLLERFIWLIYIYKLDTPQQETAYRVYEAINART